MDAIHLKQTIQPKVSRTYMNFLWISSDVWYSQCLPPIHHCLSKSYTFFKIDRHQSWQPSWILKSHAKAMVWAWAGTGFHGRGSQRAAETLSIERFWKVPNTALFIIWFLMKNFGKNKAYHQVRIACMKISLEDEGRVQFAIIMASWSSQKQM